MKYAGFVVAAILIAGVGINAQEKPKQKQAVVRKFVEIDHASPLEASNVLAASLNFKGTITPVGDNQLLLVMPESDLAEALQLLEELERIKANELQKRIFIDDQRKKEAKAEREVKTFNMKSAASREYENLIRKLIPDGSVVVSTIGPDHIVVSGTRNEIEMVSALLERVHQDVKPEDPAMTRIYRLEHLNVEVASQVIGTIANDLRIATDPRNNAIIAVGKPESHDMLEMLIQQIDSDKAPSTQIQLRIIWLTSEEMAPDAPTPPKDLDDLLKKLEHRIGLGKMRVASQLLVGLEWSEKEATQFQTSSVARFPEKVELRVGGTVVGRERGSPSIEFSISAEGEGQRYAELETRISAPANHPVVLGMTTLRNGDSLFIIQNLGSP